jgi:hypothetical protein
VQLALPSASNRQRLMIAGVAVVGASLFAVNPGTATMTAVQHRAVQLTTTDELDWSTVIGDSETNLQDLETGAATANTELSSALSTLGTEFSGQSSTGVTGFETGVQNAIDGGWYGSDDGYVEGLFPGTIIGGPDSPYTSVGTLAEVSTALQSGEIEQAFSYVDTYSLELLDHTLKPLLSSVLDETSKGTTTLSIPVELSQIQTNLLETFGTYNELKAFGDATLSPVLSVGFGLTQDLDGISTDLSGADYTQALADFTNLPSDLTGDLLNGFPTTTEPFVGLLNTGSLLDDLLVTFPEQLATALG